MKKRQAEKIVLRWYDGALYRSGTVDKAMGVVFRRFANVAFVELVARQEKTAKDGVREVYREIPALC